MDTLPPEMVSLIASHLDTKSLVRFASTCRMARDTASSLKVLRPLAVSWRQGNGVFRWLALLKNAERLRHVLIKCCACHLESWLGGARNLVSLRIDYCRVTADAIPVLPPTLEVLRIHQLVPSRYTAFSTAHLSGLDRLKDLSITFTRHWGLVIVAAGLPEKLERLELRNAATILLLAPPPASQYLHLGATYNFALNSARLLNTESLKLSCDMGDVPLESLLPREAGTLRALDIRCKDRFHAPVGHLTALTSLKYKFERVIVANSELRPLTNLRVLELESERAAHVFGPLPAFASVIAGGKRVLPRSAVPTVVVPFVPFPPWHSHSHLHLHP